jgi:hypothetical protein
MSSKSGFGKAAIKRILGELPLTAEVYWQFRQRQKPLSKSFTFSHVEKWLPEWCAAVETAKQNPRAVDKNSPWVYPKQRVMIFTTLRYWIEHATLLGMALSGLGHEVTLTYLPYANWRKPINLFDLRRHNLYANKVLKETAPWMNCVSLLDVNQVNILQENQPLLDQTSLPASLLQAIKEVSLRDTQYTLQIEEVDQSLPDESQSKSALLEAPRLYQLRLARNIQAAEATLSWIQTRAPQERPQVIITPNGSILEMGAIYQVARHLDIPVVTYEFGEQYGRIWLAQNAEVMRQETDELWEACKDLSLSDQQWEKIRSLYASRQDAQLWENFTRRWQGQPSQGGEQARQALGLDSRPVVLLAANVIGDSLTLGRQVFSNNMTAWLRKTVLFFSQRTDAQLVVRIHPGERWAQGPSVAQVVRETTPDLPPHIHVVEALDPVNTYDLVEIADLGLVYTTTVGMEMAMSGVPTIVIGTTHYRGKGFTLDPDTWEVYDKLLEDVLAAPETYRLSRQQVERAWHYAYRFFFNYPNAFPWHLLNFWNEQETWPLARVFSDEGLAEFGEVFNYLVGKPRDWTVEVADQPHAERSSPPETALEASSRL